MNYEKNQIEQLIKKITIKKIQDYKVKGPLYVNVKKINDIYNIQVKGILTNSTKLLLNENSLPIDLVETIVSKIEETIIKQALMELNTESGSTFALVSKSHDMETDSSEVNIIFKG